jgi:flagellar hook-associated protein 3 FlgL
MRLSNKQMADTIMRNLNRQILQIQNRQQMIASGKKVNRPSDDPIGMGQILDFRRTLSSIDQYNRNIDHAKMRVELVETTLSRVEDLIVEAKNWAVNLSSGSADTELMTTAASEVKNIYEQLMQLANTKLGNNYLFAGHQSNQAPFTRNADGVDGTADDWDAVYNGDTNNLQILIGDNITMDLKANGQEIFQGTVNIFDALRDLIQGLEANDAIQIGNQVTPLITAQDQIQASRAEGSARYKRLEAAQNHWDVFRLKVEDMRSNVEDADITRALVELQNLETSYEISLASSAKIIQPTLMNFLS